MNNYTRTPRASRRSKKAGLRRTLLVVCMMLVVMVGSIAGTVAWLTDTTDEVKNTFTTAGIDITLVETKNLVEGKWNAQLVPGKEYEKDPIVTVSKDTDIDVWLFVKRDDTVSKYLTYTDNLTSGNGWTKLGEKDVWYRKVTPNGSDQSWPLIGDNNKVTVKSNIVKQGTAEASGIIVMPADNSDLHLTFTAYAIQTEGFATAEAAWAEVSKLN